MAAHIRARIVDDPQAQETLASLDRTQALLRGLPIVEREVPPAVHAATDRTLARILPRWLAARAPVWLTATLVLERLLGVPALGSDWMARVVARDRPGLALWVGAFALLWAVGRRLERP